MFQKSFTFVTGWRNEFARSRGLLRYFRRFFAAEMFLFFILVGFASQEAQATGTMTPMKLAPFKALYEMTLEEARPGSGISAIRGYMVFEFTGSECAGFTLSMSLVNRITNLSGETSLMDLRSKSWEQGDGKKFTFNSLQYQNRQLVDALEGQASQANSASALEVMLARPNERKIEIAGAVLFPTQHSLVLLEAAQRGKSVVQANVYDGSEDGSKVFATTAFIGDKLEGGEDLEVSKIAGAEGLKGLPSWPVSISYFDPNSKGDAVASYELGFQLYSNGVSRALHIDYGSYVIHGALSNIEFLQTSPCK